MNKNKLPILLGCVFVSSFLILSDSISMTGTNTFNELDNNLVVKKQDGNPVSESTKVVFEGSTLNVAPLGHGYNFAAKDVRAYDDEIITNLDANIFDADWLETQYQNVICDGTSYIKSLDAYSTDINEISNSIKYGFEEETELSVGYMGMEASVGLGFAQDFEFSESSITSNCFTKSILKRKITNCALPNAANFTLYSRHLDQGFKNAVKAYFNGDITAAELFNTYGTHVLTTVSYGGIYEFNSRLSTNEFSFETAVTDSVKESVGLKATYAGITGGIKETFTQSITTKTGITFTNITYEAKGHVYGGNEDISQAALNDMAIFRDDASQSWIESVSESPIIMEYMNAYPITKYIGTGYSLAQKRRLAEELERYMSIVQLNITTDYNFSYSGKSSEFVHEFDNVFFGKYWDREVQDNISFDVTGYNAGINPATMDLFRTAGVKKLKYTFRCDFNTVKGYNHQRNVKIYLDNGSETNIKLQDKTFSQAGATPKNAFIEGFIDFEQITSNTSFRINFSEKTNSNWIWNEPLTDGVEVNLALQFII